MNLIALIKVRNSFSAGLTKCSFVSAPVNEPYPLSNSKTRRIVKNDIEAVNSSINFINDFLRSLLDVHRDVCSQITMEKSPTDDISPDRRL
jgi:hypothetical protein